MICTGGLGPTQDDLTKDVLAAFTERQLIIHEPSMKRLHECLHPEGFIWSKAIDVKRLCLKAAILYITKQVLAVGAAFTFEGTHFIVLPGPPKEMKPMFTKYAIPWLRTVMTDEVPFIQKCLNLQVSVNLT